MTFEELRIIPPILKALEAAGYEAPTPIQEAAIPPVLQGRDLLGCAQTGTGKTAAFAVPVLQRLAAEDLPHGRRPVRALVLTPTRELALQILESFEQYGSCLPLQYAVVFGGVGQAPQAAALQSGVDVLVATPGRLNDLIGQGLADLSRVEIFVLDEADRMLDMGFLHDVRRVIDRLPEKKQTRTGSCTIWPWCRWIRPPARWRRSANTSASSISRTSAVCWPGSSSGGTRPPCSCSPARSTARTASPAT